MGPLYQIQSLLQVSSAISQSQETPFFRSGIVLSRDTWFGRLISCGWRVAEFFGIADEKNELDRIVAKAKSVFLSIQQNEFQFSDDLVRSFIYVSYLPDYDEKVSVAACQVLGCSYEHWHQALRRVQKRCCLEVLDELTPTSLAQTVLTDVVCKTKGKDVIRSKQQWVAEVQPIFSHVPSQLLWDCFEKILNTSEDEASCQFALELFKTGLPLDKITDHKRVDVSESADLFPLLDERFLCCVAKNTSAQTVLFAKNGFLIPLWRAHVSQKKTLFRLVDCYGMDPTRKVAYIENIQGLFTQCCMQIPSAMSALCGALRLWLQTRGSFHPKVHDLYLTSLGDLVTFEPVFEEKEPFSIVEIEEFIQKLGLVRPLRRDVFEKIGFFSLDEVRKVEEMWLEFGLGICESDIARELACRGIEDSAMYKSVVQISRRAQCTKEDQEQTKEYLQKAHEEGFFFRPYARDLLGLESSCTHVAKRPVTWSLR